MNTIAIMFMIHDELKIKDIFQEVIEAIQHQTISVDVWVFGDKETPKAQWEMIPSEWHKEKAPGELLKNIPLTHKYAYDLLVKEGYQYIMINQGDDTPYLNRAEKQLNAMLEYPSCGVSLCGFELYRNGNKEKEDYFQQIHCGFNVGYPSCWMLSTFHVPSFPELIGFERPYDIEWDPYILLTIQQTSPILILQEPLEVYRLYSGNLSSLVPREINTNRVNMLCNYYSHIKSKLSQIIQIPRNSAYGHKKTIMVISLFKVEQYGYAIAKLLERDNYTVIRIGTDWLNEHLDPKLDLNLFKDYLEYRELKNYFPIIDLLKKYPQTDLIFLSQSPVFVFDLKGINIPLIYYQQDIIFSRFPINAKNHITYFLYAYYGAVEQMYAEFPIEMKSIKNAPIYMSYGAQIELFPSLPLKKRDIFLGFKGTINWEECESEPFSLYKTPLYRTIYNNRRRFLDYAKENLGLIIETRNNRSSNEYNEWLEFMRKVTIAINIPGNWGWVNERQYIIPLCGCVLLQWRYPQLIEQGYIDYENCLLFSTEEELKAKVEWAKDHLDELVTIQHKGELLVRTMHTFEKRYELLRGCFPSTLDVPQKTQEIIVQPIKCRKPMTILCIGWFQPDKHMAGIAKGFEMLGHKVIRVYTEGYPLESLVPIDNYWMASTNNPQKMERVYNLLEPLEMKYIERCYPEIDCIFLQQGTYNYSVKGCHHPVFYFHNELMRYTYPKGYIHGIYYAFDGGFQQLYWNNRLLFDTTKYKKLVTYAVDPELFPNAMNPNRPIFFGFCGAVASENGSMNTIFMRDIYNNRTRFLAYCQLKHGLQITNRVWGPTMFDFYRDHIMQYYLTINIPGNWGKYNQRQFEHLAAGNLLLQWYYPELVDRGYQDRVNCLLFRDESDLDNQILWVKEHPKEAEQVRINGIQFARTFHTWTQRAKTMLKDMEPTVSEFKQEQLLEKFNVDKDLFMRWHTEEYKEKGEYIPYHEWAETQKKRKGKGKK